MRILVILACCAAPLMAQSAAVPRLGWISGQEPSRLHEVLGLPGAAQLGPPLTLCDAAILAVRPGSNLAVVIRSDGAAGLLRLQPGRQDAGWEELAEAVRGADLAVWSPLGEALVLSSAAEGRLQVWRSAEGVLRLAYEVPLAAARAAVSDSGTLLAESGGILYLAGPDGSLQTLDAAAGGAFTFLAGSGLYARMEGAVLRIEGGEQGPVLVELPEGMDAQRILLLSLRRAPLVAVAAGEEAATVAAWDASGRSVGQWQIPAAVRLVRHAGPEDVVELVTQGGPVWMASFTDSGGRVFFVPRQHEGGEEQ